MPSEDKVKEVAELEQVLAQAPVVIATGYRGMKVADLFQLRKQLRAQGLRYRVVKNTLARLAAEKAGRPDLVNLLRGPTGLALGAGDPVAATKTIQDFIRTTKQPLEVYGALIDGHPYSPKDLDRLVTLPPRDVLIAQLLGSIQGPLSGLLGILSAPVQNLLWLLQARVEQLGGTSE